MYTYIHEVVLVIHMSCIWEEIVASTEQHSTLWYFVACSHTGHFLVCGSEDQFVYIWRVQHEFHKFSSARRDRSDYWEAIKGTSTVSQYRFTINVHLSNLEYFNDMK